MRESMLPQRPGKGRKGYRGTTIVSTSKIAACMCVVRVYAHFRSFPSFPRSRHLSSPQNLLHSSSRLPFPPEIRSLNLPMINLVPEKGKIARRGIFRITVFRFQPESGYTRTVQLKQSKQSARCDGVHAQTHAPRRCSTPRLRRVAKLGMMSAAGSNPRKGGLQKAFRAGSPQGEAGEAR